MEVIKLNLIPGKACPVVHVSQFDDGREFKAELYEGVNVYTLDGTETLTAIVKKPDGNEVTAAVTNTSDNYVIITTTEQMTACAGGNLGTLKIEKGAVTIATLNFILECQASPDTGIQSDSEIHNLEAQVNQMVEDAVAEQYDSNNVLFDTAPTSGHGVPYAVTSGGLWSWLRDLPLRAYPTASGSIATFDTSLALPLQDCTIAINAVQEGTGVPSPQNIRNLVGFTGANIRVVGSNLWDEEWEAGGLNNNTGEPTTSNRIRSKNFMPITPNTQIRCVENGVPNTEDINVFFYDKNQNFISHANWQTTPTTPANCFYFKLHTAFAYGLTYKNDLSINYPATDTAYHAYNANSTTTAITWQYEAGTVYGGSLDVTTGVLTVTYGMLDLAVSDMNNSEDYPGWKNCGVKNIVGMGVNTLITNGMVTIGDKFNVNTITNDVIFLNKNTYGLTQSQWINTYPSLTIRFVIPYATPVTYQLTPTQISAIVGTNNVFTDTNGDTSVVYACSLKDYIDSQ